MYTYCVKPQNSPRCGRLDFEVVPSLLEKRFKIKKQKCMSFQYLPANNKQYRVKASLWTVAGALTGCTIK